MEIIMKKIKSLIMVVSILLASMESLPVMASFDGNYAKEILQQQEKSEGITGFVTYTENRGDYEYIEKKISMESENYILDKEYNEIEKFLNDSGVFDEEISLHFSEEMLNDLKEVGSSDISIASAYYAVDDSYTDEEISIDKGILNKDNMVRLNEQEVNKYLAEKYFEEQTDLYDEIEIRLKGDSKRLKEIPLKDKIMQAIGLEPM